MRCMADLKQNFRARSNEVKCAAGWTTESLIVQISSGLQFTFPYWFAWLETDDNFQSQWPQTRNAWVTFFPLISSHTILLSVMQNIFNAEIFNHKFVAFILGTLWTRLRNTKKHFFAIHLTEFRRSTEQKLRSGTEARPYSLGIHRRLLTRNEGANSS